MQTSRWALRIKKNETEAAEWLIFASKDKILNYLLKDFTIKTNEVFFCKVVELSIIISRF